jgi:uncharacterized protein (DUF1015 family)
MSDVRPFRALRYARELTPRLAGPYDVISDAERAQLAREPENVVHLTLPPGTEGERDYASAADTLARWRREGVLVRDTAEQIYALEETTSAGRLRRGFLALLRLADYEQGVVLPHENTMPGPKRDRLALTRSVRANLEPLFFTYEDRDGKLDPVLDGARGEAPLAEARGPDGTGLVLRGVAARDAVRAVQSFLAERPVIIADGHHRYETMLSYRDECRRESGGGGGDDAPHEFVLAYLVNAFDPGSEIRSIHRRLDGELNDPAPLLSAAGFACRELPWSLDGAAVERELAAVAADACAFAIAGPGPRLLLATRPRGDRLDVEVLHDEILPAIGGELSFDSRATRLLEAVFTSEAALGIFLHPIAPDALFRVVRAGARLPKKSTFFTPKIPSGLLIRDF